MKMSRSVTMNLRSGAATVQCAKRPPVAQKNVRRSRLRAVVEAAEEEGPGVRPEEVGGARRDAEDLGGLCLGHTGEVAQLDEFGGLRVGGGQAGQGLVQ